MFPFLLCGYVSDPSAEFFFCVSSGSISGCYSQVAAVVIDDSSKVIVAAQYHVVWSWRHLERHRTGPRLDLDSLQVSACLLLYLQLSLLHFIWVCWLKTVRFDLTVIIFIFAQRKKNNFVCVGGGGGGGGGNPL